MSVFLRLLFSLPSRFCLFNPSSSVYCILLLVYPHICIADRRFEVKCPTRRASFWVKFPTVWSLTRVKCPGIAPGGWAVLEFSVVLTLTSDVIHAIRDAIQFFNVNRVTYNTELERNRSFQPPKISSLSYVMPTQKEETPPCDLSWSHLS